MPEPETRDAALSSALDIVQEVRGVLEQLRSRLGSEEEAAPYLATLEEASSFTEQMTSLLASASNQSAQAE